MSKKILIFYISKHSGHYHAARAIEKAILQIDDSSSVELVNALHYTNPILGAIINKAYLEVIKKKPELWGNIYDNPEVLKKTKKAREHLHRFNMSKIRRLIEKKGPDIVFCTQAFPCGMVADYKRTSGSDLTLVGVLTDHAPHSYWIHEEVDYYAVPSESTALKLEKKGVDREKVRACGIPVDPKFAECHKRENILKGLDLEPERPTILIMGGSQGLGAIDKVVKSLLEDEKHDYQMLVVTGINKKLFRKLSRKGRKFREYVRVFPFVDNIDELMEASDMIITKAGGITTAEALAKKLPILIVEPIPGHERMNADYLVEAGAAVEIDDYYKMHERINRLFDSGKLAEMKKQTKALSMPASAMDIAKFSLKAIR